MASRTVLRVARRCPCCTSVPSALMSTANAEASGRYLRCSRHAALVHAAEGKITCPEAVSNATFKACGFGCPTKTRAVKNELLESDEPNFLASLLRRRTSCNPLSLGAPSVKEVC